MGLFGKNPNEANYVGGGKHWADVIKNDDRSGEALIWRAPEEDFNTSSTLIVMPGEEAVFIKDGVIEQIFDNGRYQLSTENYPFLSRLTNAFTGGISTFNCVVYFVRKAHSKEILWGTATPIQVEDPKYRILVKIKAYGAFKVEVDDAGKFLTKMIGGTRGLLQDELVVNYFSNEMQQHIRSSFKRAIQASGSDVIDVVGEPDILAGSIRPIVDEIFDDYGIKLRNFVIGGIFVDEDDPSFAQLKSMKVKKSERELYGDDWARIRGMDVMSDMANNPGAGGVAAMGVGLGMGAGVSGAMGGMADHIFQSQDPRQAAPQVGPVEKIRQLKELLDIGALSQEEFDAKKRELLSQM